jgi:hypothetical protein
VDVASWPMLSHLLHLRGVDSVVIGLRRRQNIDGTIKAGVLEQGTVDLMTATGVGDRLRRDGFVHHGINLAFLRRPAPDQHVRADRRAGTVYAQQQVLTDLIAKRLSDGAMPGSAFRTRSAIARLSPLAPVGGAVCAASPARNSRPYCVGVRVDQLVRRGRRCRGGGRGNRRGRGCTQGQQTKAVTPRA